MESERYKTIGEAIAERPTMPDVLVVGLAATAANAQFLLDQINGENLYLVEAAVLLFTMADQVIAEWDVDPDKWLSGVTPSR